MLSRKWLLPTIAVGLLGGGPCHAGSSSVADQLATGLENIFQDTQSAQTASTVAGYASTASSLDTVWHIGSDLGSTFSQAISATNNSNAQTGEQQANQAFDNFVHNALPSDLVSLIVPGGSGTIQKAENMANGIESTANSVEDSASAVANRVSSYLSGSSDYGLEPGSSDAQAAQQAVDASGQTMTVDTSQLPPDEGTGAATESLSAGESSPSGQQASVSNQSANMNVAAATYTPADSGAATGSSAEPNAGTPEQYPTIKPISMTSSDPNSCIRSSDSLGVPSVSIDCGAKSSTEALTSGSSARQASSSSANELLQELQQGGIDTSSSGNGNSSAITSSDLAGIGGTGSSGSGSSDINVTELQASIAKWDQQQAAKAQALKYAQEQEATAINAQAAVPQGSSVSQAPTYSSATSSYSGNSSNPGGDCNSVLTASQQRWCNIPNDGSICDNARAAEVCFEHGAEDGAHVCPSTLISQLQQEAAGAEQTANSVCVNGAAPVWQTPPASPGFQAPPPPPTPWYQTPQGQRNLSIIGSWLAKKIGGH